MSKLRVSNLTKRFGGLVAVSDVSFDVENGQILGLIGPNGAGKTTCFNIIAGAMSSSEGNIFFNDSEITGLPAHKINNKGIARTFQIVKPLKKLTVYENIMIAALTNVHKIADAKKIACEVIEFTRLDDIQNKRTGELSIGNLKRVEIARALATKPELLLLDEPMGGLNGKEIDQAIDLILKIKESGKTIVIIEHIMKALMKVSDKIVVLAQGKKIAEGEPGEVAKNPAVITAYLGEEYNASSQ